MGQIGPKWDKYGSFSDQISVHFSAVCQSVLRSDLKSPIFVPLGIIRLSDLLVGPNWTSLGCKEYGHFDTRPSIVGLHSLLCLSLTSRLKQVFFPFFWRNFIRDYQIGGGNFIWEYQIDGGNFIREYQISGGNFIRDYQISGGNFFWEYQIGFGNFMRSIRYVNNWNLLGSIRWKKTSSWGSIR